LNKYFISDKKSQCKTSGKTIDWNETLTLDAQVAGIEVVTLLISISIKHVLDVPNRVKSVALKSAKKKRDHKGLRFHSY
jgi:hypothetical protein